MSANPTKSVPTLATAASGIRIAARPGQTRTAQREPSAATGKPTRSRGHRAMGAMGLLGLLLVAVTAGGRELLQIYQPNWLTQWAFFLRRPLEQQITGFAMVGLLVIGMLLPLARKLRAGSKQLWLWRTVHALVGTLAIAGLVSHTGLRLGANLNLWLSILFLALCVLGAYCSLAMGGSPPVHRGLKIGRRLHVLLFWPVIAFIGLHVLASYYF